MAKPNNLRKPAELEMIGGKSKRQRMWESIRARRDGFVLIDIASDANADLDTTKAYLQALGKGGYIEAINPERSNRDVKRYRLIKDNGLEAPRLSRDGKPVTQGRAREQMWRTMRIIGADFNCLELAGLASTPDVIVGPAAAKSYLKHLAHAGYVTIVVRGKGRSTGGTMSRYRFNLARYTGPRPPMVQRTQSIFDPNLGKVVWQEEVNDDDL